jgi:hypothetical protein
MAEAMLLLLLLLTLELMLTDWRLCPRPLLPLLYSTKSLTAKVTHSRTRHRELPSLTQRRCPSLCFFPASPIITSDSAIGLASPVAPLVLILRDW